MTGKRGVRGSPLCFGWIDSLMQPLDAERYMQLFTPRKPKSGWSRANKERVARLVEAGRMALAGLAKIEEAKKNGAWRALDAVEELTVPPELTRALRSKAGALKNFQAYIVQAAAAGLSPFVK